MYKVGDKVLLYSWDELVNMYGDVTGNLPDNYWCKTLDDRIIPRNRIVTIVGCCEEYKTLAIERGGTKYNIWNLVKRYANEYYLQKIKEELDTE